MSKVKKVFFALTLLILAACTPALESVNKTANNADNPATVAPQQIESEYLQWLINEEGTFDSSSFVFQIPEITIDSYVVDCINEEIKSRFLKPALTFMEDPFMDIQIKTACFIDDKIISLKILQTETGYGTDGDIYTVNYSIEHDSILPFSYVLQKEKITYQELMQDINDKFKSQNCRYLKASSFYIDKNGSTIIVITSLDHNPEIEPWKHLFYYNVSNKEIVKSD